MSKPVVDLVAALEESLAKAKRDHALRVSQPTDDSGRIRPHAARTAPEPPASTDSLAPPTNGHTEDLPQTAMMLTQPEWDRLAKVCRNFLDRTEWADEGEAEDGNTQGQAAIDEMRARRAVCRRIMEAA